jgi:hypothetical protein
MSYPARAKVAATIASIMIPRVLPLTRRRFLRNTAAGLAGAAASLSLPSFLMAQEKGERPPAPPKAVEVLNPLGRVPVALIIDDSTCLVNLNRFAVPQFAEAWQNQRQLGQAYNHNWRDWPHEIPDSFVRKFGEWCAENGVKGKYSVVPYPACVGRLDRGLPGWTGQQLRDSIKLVRELMTPNWDIHPEMITHTRAIDTKTGHPYPEVDLRHMENWDFSVGRSADEIADYTSYALRILKEIGLPCEGITTPGGFGSKAMPSLAKGTLDAVRAVYGADVSHYFRNLYDKGEQSVAPLVQYAAGLGGDDPRCVVSIIGCTGDWTGGWDNSLPVGADAFITPDLQKGRMVDVIGRGEPAVMVCHWTGIYFNGQELGFQIFREVVGRLRQRYGQNIVWMKLGEIARYWAAKELTTIETSNERTIRLKAPFACPNFTLRLPLAPSARLDQFEAVDDAGKLRPGTYRRDGDAAICCLDLKKGATQLRVL